ncbi:MAG: hypothetical protein JG775_2136, partial [Defluviitaleaceae bacterium]|nr:hypothetical protein [Defluviitaleaceae bacterium]
KAGIGNSEKFPMPTTKKRYMQRVADIFLDGRNRARTYDPLLVRQVLSQLSYAPLW